MNTPPVRPSRLRRFAPVRPAAPPWSLPQSHAVGVGSMSSVSRRPPPRDIDPAPRWRSPFRSLAIGVGSNDPHPVAPMIRADVPSAQHSCRSHITQPGKSFDDSDKAASSKIRGIFDEDKCRPNFANNAEHFKPKARARACEPGASAGAADSLARESAADDVDEPAPEFPVEGSDVIPDRERLESVVALPSDKRCLGERFDFHRANGSPAKQLSSEQSAACPGK
jgi:hypothetical protein